MSDRLIVSCHVDRRSTQQRIHSTKMLDAKMDNEFARAVLERQALHSLAVACYPGTPLLEAHYEQRRWELMQKLPGHLMPAVKETIAGCTAFNHMLGARDAIIETAPCIWRPATDLDL